MSAFGAKMGVLSAIFAGMKRIKARTWLIIAAICMAFFALLVWAAIALLGWAWSGTKGILQSAGVNTESIQQATTEASQLARQAVERAREGIGQLPSIASAKEATTQQLKESLEQAELKARSALNEAAPAIADISDRVRAGQSAAVEAAAIAAAASAGVLAAKLPAESTAGILREVSGEDLSPDLAPERFPGLIRTAFSQDGNKATWSYTGVANLADVVQHYQRGFAALGYEKRVASADLMHERLVFSKDSNQIDLEVREAVPGQLQVRVVHMK